MNRVNALIESLIEWMNVCELSDDEFNGFLFHLSYSIGSKDSLFTKTVDQLKERIQYLIEKQQIKEKFLVNAIILEMNNYFEHYIKNHGEAIVVNELMAEAYKQNYGFVPDHIQDGIIRLKERGYRYNLECQYDVWKLTIQENFTYLREREWERLDNEKFSKRVKDQSFGLSEEQLNTPLKELKEKLSGR